MKALKDPPPPPVTTQRTTLGALFRRTIDRSWHPWVTLILPRHCFLLNEKTRNAYPVIQRVWVEHPETKALCVIVVVRREDDPEPVMLGLLRERLFEPFVYRPSDNAAEPLVLATNQRTAACDSLQYRAARVIAENWESYSEEARETICDATLLTDEWDALLK